MLICIQLVDEPAFSMLEAKLPASFNNACVKLDGARCQQQLFTIG